MSAIITPFPPPKRRIASSRAGPGHLPDDAISMITAKLERIKVSLDETMKGVRSDHDTASPRSPPQRQSFMPC
jgi:hypothetical protein